MKKLIALSLMVVCLGMYSLGCAKKEAPPTPASEPAPATEPAAEEGTPAAEAPKAE